MKANSRIPEYSHTQKAPLSLILYASALACFGLAWKIGDPNDLLLWFEIDDIDDAIARADSLGAEVIVPRHRNPPHGDGGPNHSEMWLRDLDGYKVVLASPDGTADGNWQP